MVYKSLGQFHKVMCTDNDDDIKVLECQHQQTTDAEENSSILDGFGTWHLTMSYCCFL